MEKKGYLIISDETNIYELGTITEVGCIVYTDLDDAKSELHRIVDDAKTNGIGKYSWVARKLSEIEFGITEEWLDDDWVALSDEYKDNTLEIHIKEVNIV